MMDGFGTYLAIVAGIIIAASLGGGEEVSERFFLAQDDDCHWYLVPVDKREEWSEWREIPSDDERSWDVPDFATAIDGPHLLTFTDPQ